MQYISHEIWDSKYRLKDANGNPIDRTLDDTFERVAGALANVEEKPDEWYEPFLWALKNGAVPAGRIMSNAGAQDHKPGTSLINCLAAGTPVLTREGVRPIEGLVGKVVEVLNGNGRWTPVQFQSFGLQKTYATIWRWASNKRTRITVRATADHRWFLTDGRVITTEYWLTAPHLPLRCRTVPHIRPKEVNIEASEWRRGLIHGLVFGDGTQYCGYSTLSLCGGKLALVTLVGELTGVKPNFYTSESGCPVARFHLSGEFNQVICDDFKRLPTGCSDGYLVGFFSGLLATDGTVAKNNRGCQISIFGTHELVEFLIAQLPVVGIGWTFKRRAGVRGDKTNLGVRSKDLWTLSFQPSTVDDRFILRPEHQAKFKNTRDGDLACTRWILHSIDTTPVLEEVFCCSEPETTAFVLASGLKTGQCVVSDTIPDSMEGILAKLAEAGLSLKAGCGIGYEFSTLRPKGAKVMGPGAYTSGPLPFMDVFDALCTTVSSAGGRRGAQMATFDASHPDVLDFIRAKRQDGRLRQFNLSLLVSDRLMDAVKAGAEWPLVFSGREEVYPSIQASALWDEIMRSTYEYAEPGVLFIDRINQYNNLWWCEDIRATNPCVVGSTRLHTSRGLVRMDELYRSGESLRVIADRRGLGLEGTGVEVRDAVPVFMSSPSAEIYRVQTKAGYSLRATAWHRLPTDRGSVEVKDLREGDTLLIQSGEGLFGGQGSEQLGLLLGLIAGDGYFTDHEGCQEATVQLWGAKRVVAEGVETFVNAILSGLSERGRTYQARFCPVAKRDVISLGSILLARYLEQFGFTADTKLRVPEVVWQGTRECVVGYLRGLFLSDGSVQGGGHGRCSIRLSSSEPNLLYDVQVLLANFGIFCGVYHRRRAGERLLPDGRGGLKSYWCRDNYELIVDGESRELFGEKIGFLHPEHLRKFSTRSLNASTSRPRRFATKVTSVTFDGVEPVYDTTQPDHNLVTFNGLVSHQCGEQPLSSYGACLLGSVDLTKFVRNPLSPEVQFDWIAYRKVVSIFTRMLDNVVEIANLPLPEQREELRRKRRHGMGVLGLGSAMAMLGIRYGSSESCSFTGTVMRVMAEVGWEQAVLLAQEKGPAPIMGEYFEVSKGMLEKRPELSSIPPGKICGSTLFAMGSHYMNRLSEVYPTIVEDLAYYGARFTHHTSIAPTGTIALAFANNASNGIEPSFAHQYTRNLTKQGRKTREAVEVYSAEALLWQEKYGNEPYPDYFVTAEQVSPKEHIDVQAVAQRWVDSSISKTINCPTGMSFEEFKEVYQYAYEKGLKGCATFRFNPEFQQGILVTAENLANTQYRFRLDDGTLIEARGDEVIEYEGESHSVANLYDALKEGRYGRY